MNAQKKTKPVTIALTPAQMQAKQRGRRIKLEMDRQGLNQEQLAKRVGTSQTMISKIIAGRPEKTKLLTSIAAALGVSSDWLETGAGSKTLFPANSLRIADHNADLFELCDEGAVLGVNQIALPIIGKRKHEGLKLVLAKKTLEKYGVAPENATYMVQEGNSNAPFIPDGSPVGIDLGRTDVEDGKLFVVEQKNGEQTHLRVKFVYNLPTGGLRLRSFNNDEYPDEYYSPDQLDGMRIVGRVFWYTVFMT